MRTSWLLRLGLSLVVVLALVSLTGGFTPSAANDTQPDAACKMMPQCDTDADCTVWCGGGAGKCIHSSCPIRICRCR